MKKLYPILIAMLCATIVNAQSDIHPDSTVVKIKCVDQDKLPEDSALVELINPDGSIAAAVYSNIDGLAKCTVKRGVVYNLKTSKYKTTKEQDPLNCANAKMNLLLKIKFYEKKYAQKWELAVYFKTNEHTLDFEDLSALNALYEKMVENQTMHVEIAAHTDNVGNDAYNLRLSQRRANSVRQYIIGKGIPEDRIVSKGYGETDPVDTNETEEGRAKNRRTEVRVLAI